MNINSLVIFISIFSAAVIYSSVGHGGASGYLAVMALFSFSVSSMKSTALLLNLIVSLIAFISFYKKSFRWRILFLFIITSIPAAYIGAGLLIPDKLFKVLLATFLLFSGSRLLLNKPDEKENSKRETNYFLKPILGVIIGFISGIIGIGGGIILSPIIIFYKWADVKETAAISAAFILFNSLAGLIAISSGNKSLNINWSFLFPVFIGGILGSFAGSRKFDSNFSKKILSAVIIIAVIKLLIY